MEKEAGDGPSLKKMLMPAQVFSEESKLAAAQI